MDICFFFACVHVRRSYTFCAPFPTKEVNNVCVCVTHRPKSTKTAKKPRTKDTARQEERVRGNEPKFNCTHEPSIYEDIIQPTKWSPKIRERNWNGMGISMTLQKAYIFRVVFIWTAEIDRVVYYLYMSFSSCMQVEIFNKFLVSTICFGILATSKKLAQKLFD